MILPSMILQKGDAKLFIILRWEFLPLLTLSVAHAGLPWTGPRPPDYMRRR